jgi:putative ABC transport system substrate-binding protein
VISRRAFTAAVAWGLAALPVAARAQPQPAKVPRVGFLGVASEAALTSRVEAFRAGLRELGYAEGKNLVIEYRWADGNYDRLPDLAADLVRLKVDVLVTSGTPGTLAAKRATTTIPIVMAVTGDSVGTGLVASLARPGGNVTGSTVFGPEHNVKRLELLKAVMPRLARVAFLFNPDNPSRATDNKDMESAARSMKLEISYFEARQPAEFDAVFTAMAKRHAGGVVVTDDAMLNSNSRRIAETAEQKRVPSAGNTDLAEAGGLIGYGVNVSDMFRRAAYFVDKIVRGAKPGDLPVERATKFDLVINLKTAKALGVTIPPSVLGRADHVIQP